MTGKEVFEQYWQVFSDSNEQLGEIVLKSVAETAKIWGEVASETTANGLTAQTELTADAMEAAAKVYREFLDQIQSISEDSES